MLFLKQKVKTMPHDLFLHDNVTKTEEYVKRLKTQSRPSADRNTTDFFTKATANFFEQSSLTDKQTGPLCSTLHV